MTRGAFKIKLLLKIYTAKQMKKQAVINSRKGTRLYKKE